MKISELITKLNKYDPDTEVCSTLWFAEDIEMTAGNMNDVSLSDDEVNDILSILESNHDANEGINWDVIEITIELYVSGYFNNGEPE